MTDTGADDFEANIEKMARIAEVVKKFDNPDVQARAYDALAANAFGSSARGTGVSHRGTPRYEDDGRVDLDLPDDTDGSSRKSPAKKSAGKRGGKKPALEIPKNVDYAPSGKQSLPDFAAEKSPSNNMEKALVAAYYLQEVLGRTVTTGEVTAIFRALGWTDPTDPVNNLQKAGNKHWLDTSNMADIKVIWAGDRYVKNDLPKKTSK